MTQRRVVRVISYEGLDAWVAEVLARSPLNGRLRAVFRRQGTVRELQRIELGEHEELAGPLTTRAQAQR